MLRTSIILVASLVATSAFSAEAPMLAGRWAAKPSWCKNSSADTAEVAQVFTLNGLEGYENSCTYTRVSGTNPVEVSMTCHGEGLTSKERSRYAIKGNRMTVTELTGPSHASYVLHRCAR